MLKNTLSDTGIAEITLNRPDVHNAFNADLITALGDTFAEFGSRGDVRAIVLRGEGKTFSAGADLNWMKAAAGFSHEENRDDALALSHMLDAIHTCPKPVLAIVQGAAMGGGVGLTACADIVIAVDGTKFALSEVRLGLTPATISPYVIEAIGARHARRYFLTAERFDAHKARDIGLVHEVAETLKDAETLADQILANILAGGPDAIRHAKELVLSVSGKAITKDLRAYTARAIADRRTSDEGQEGLTASLEKRPPLWLKNR